VSGLGLCETGRGTLEADRASGVGLAVAPCALWAMVIDAPATNMKTRVSRVSALDCALGLPAL